MFMEYFPQCFQALKLEILTKIGNVFHEQKGQWTEVVFSEGDVCIEKVPT